MRLILRRPDWRRPAYLMLLAAALCAPMRAAVAVTVTPASVTLTNGGSVTFSATVTGSANQQVVWAYSPGNVGNPSGAVYTAPATITTAQVVTVTVSAVADINAKATATIYLIPSQVSVRIAPRDNLSLYGGQSMTFVAAVAGASDPNVNWRVSGGGTVSAATGTTTVYTAPASSAIPSSGRTVTLTATSVADSSISDSVTINLLPSVAISISPTSATLGPGQSQTFVATVTGNADTSVTWSISPNIGTISGGVYTAPSTLSGAQTVTVTATSNANPNRTASATVTLQAGISVSVRAASTSLSSSDTTQVTATVTGTSNTAVTWSLTPNLGTISGSGATVTYRAPDTVSANTSVTVIATSVADSTKSGAVTIALTQSSSVGITVSPKSVTLKAGETQQFAAVVSGTGTQDVFWSINPGNVGTITQTGLYTAPSTITASQTVTLTVTSLADLNKTTTATITLSTTSAAIDVGTGAPNASIQQLFIQAFYRNAFNAAVSLPPSAQVRRFGTVGWYQTFSDANKSGLTFAIVMPSSNLNLADGSAASAWQVWADVWSAYNSTGANTAGYPTGDTQQCGYFSATNSCTYQFFDKNYVIFGYKNALPTGQTFSIRNTFYTAWVALGEVNGLGRPVDGESSVTSAKGGAATMQVYSNGVAFNITTAATNLPAGKTFAVRSPIYETYQGRGGYQGSYGFPISDEIILASGVHRQQFQSGSIEYLPGSDPSERPPVAAVAMQAVSTGGALRMDLGDTVQVSATAVSASGTILADRTVSWSTTNSRVVQLVGTGATVTLKAVGGGNAKVTASSEGKTSAPLQVVVTARCCLVGEGAPTAAIQQAFQDAVARDKLNFVQPADSPVRRLGSGYAQELIAADTGALYLLAKADSSASAYYVTGNLLARYLDLGGPAGGLGYPVGNPTPGGRQVFENNAALAGNPVRLVSGAMLARWALLGSETGAAGPPVSEAGTVVSFTTSSGSLQGFTGGMICTVTAGARSGQAYFVSGPILARYQLLGGPGGAFGLPAGDEFSSGELRRQNFEGGTIEYKPGEAAVEQASPRQPTVVATPAAAIAGTRVRLAVYGFAENSTLRVSVTGRPDFQVTTANGAYGWDVYVPAGASPGTVEIHAADIQTKASADGSYTVKSYLEAGVGLTKVQGDNQTGAPGSRLIQPLRVALRDGSGNPIAGATVVFAASPGAVVAPASALTDGSGLAETWLRLPKAGGTALATADAPGVALAPVTFQALAAGSRLMNFAPFTQVSGALLTSTAAILRYHQDRGELASGGGLADPAALEQFLKNYCTADAGGNPVCDGFLSNPDGGDKVVNLWRAGEFTGGGVDVSVEASDENTIRDLVAQGSPVLLSLALSAEGVAAGGHYVVATGVADDAGLVIYDPSPEFARTRLADYTAGFAAAGHLWKGEVRGAVRLALRTPSSTRFLLAAVSQPPGSMAKLSLEAVSAVGSCGRALELVDAAVATATASGAPRVSRVVACDGTQPSYQVNVGTDVAYRVSVTDLAAGGGVTDLSGSAPAAWRATRPVLGLVLARQEASLAADAVVNAATAEPGTAPGGLVSILGNGLSGPGAASVVALDDVLLEILSATPFRLNVRIPGDMLPGMHRLRIQSPYGIAEQSVEIREVAPVIFLLEGRRGALVNPAGTINSPTLPVRRGETLLIYAIGLGAMVPQGDVSVVTKPVTAVINGQELPVAFAGWAAGLDPGVYQVNLAIPASLAPGVDLSLALRQGGVESNLVAVAVE